MNIRSLRVEDIDKLREIYKSYYSDKLEFPDFLHNFLCAFVVVNEHDQVITGGGVRLIPEAVLFTDLGSEIKERRAALYQVLDACEFITKRADFDRIYAATKDDNWTRHLNKVGFHSRGNFLVYDLI